MTATKPGLSAPQDVATRFDASTGTVHATVIIASPPTAVFRALTTPSELAKWWGSAEWYRTHDWKLDLRPGGSWSVRIDQGGREVKLGGEVLAVRAPELLEYTWRAEFDDFHPTTVRYELAPMTVNGAEGTRLTLTHSGMKDQEALSPRYTSGWVKTLEWLAAYTGQSK